MLNGTNKIKENLSHKYQKSFKLKKSKKFIKLKFSYLLKILGLKLDKKSKLLIKKKFDKYKLSYSNPTTAELDSFFYFFINFLKSDFITKSGKKKYISWESGWKQNFNKYKRYKKTKYLKPAFVRNSSLLRIKGKYIKPATNNFESKLFDIVRNVIFLKYFKNINNIYEFGCGTGHNLIALREIFPQKKYFGLDYAKFSQKILSLINKKHKNISGANFNITKPSEFELNSNSGVFTCGALEQVGLEYINFFEYLKLNKPKVVINFETMHELYNNSNISDYLSKEYLSKRNYLKNYLTFLRKKEELKIIQILQCKRVFGSQFHEGYSFVCFKFV